jgi:PST family polysaccharide transporter
MAVGPELGPAVIGIGVEGVEAAIGTELVHETGDDDGQLVGAPAGAELLRASVLTLASSATGLMVGLFRSKLLAILLGPAGVGVLANLGIYNTLIATASGAIAGQGATRAIAAARSDGTQDQIDWLIRYAVLVPALIGVIVMVGSMALAAPISGLVMGDQAYAPLVAVSALAIPAGLLAASYSSILQGFVHIGSLARVGISTTLLSVIVLLSLILPFGLTGAAIASVVTALIQIGLFARREPWILRRRWLRRLEFHWPWMKPIVQLGLAGVILGIASTLTNLLIRSEIVGRLGIEQNGIYQPVAAISETYLELFISSTSFYLFPKLTQLLSAGQRREATAELGHGLRLMLVVTVPFLLIGIGGGREIISLLYTPRFAEAADPLAIQMLGNLAKVVTWSVGAALLPLGMYRAWLGIGLVSVAIRYVGVRVMVGPLGLAGAAIAYDLGWFWSAAMEVGVVVLVGRLVLSRRDWRSVTVGAILVGLTFASRSFGDGVAMITALAATLCWVVALRGEVLELLVTLRSVIRPHLRSSKGSA